MDMPVEDGLNTRPLRQVVQERLEEEGILRSAGDANGCDTMLMPLDLYMLIEQMALSNPIYMVEEFHRVFGHSVRERPIVEMKEGEISDEELERSLRLRLDLLTEEMQEYYEAQLNLDTHGMCDALCDIIVVAVGAALELGLPVRLGMLEVHRSNMSKLGADGKPIYRADGKILKGPNYTEPNWVEVFQEWEAEHGRV